MLCAIFESAQSIDRAAADSRILSIHEMRNNLSIAAIDVIDVKKVRHEIAMTFNSKY